MINLLVTFSLSLFLSLSHSLSPSLLLFHSYDVMYIWRWLYRTLWGIPYSILAYLADKLFSHVNATHRDIARFCFPWPKGHVISLFTQSPPTFHLSADCMCFPKLDEWRSGLSLSFAHGAANLLKNVLSSPYSVTLIVFGTSLSSEQYTLLYPRLYHR